MEVEARFEGLEHLESLQAAEQDGAQKLLEAIGAQTQDIVHGMLSYAARLTVAGVVLGAAGGIAATRLLSSLLFGITPLDWRTFAGVAMLLMLVALAAAYVPTRRAALVDPVIALRDDR